MLLSFATPYSPSVSLVATYHFTLLSIPRSWYRSHLSCEVLRSQKLLVCNDSPDSRLVGTLERRDGLALVLVQRRANDTPVAELNLTLGLLLEGQGVLHPVLVVSVGEVLAGVGTTRLLTVGSGNGRLGATSLSVSCFSLQAITIILTRKSTSFSARESQRDPSSRSCCGP